jgi:hypothetical protein
LASKNHGALCQEDEIRKPSFLVPETYRTPLKTLGAVKGLEALLRQNPQHRIGETARARLRQLVRDPDPRIRRLALTALQTARDVDETTLGAAATDADWQVRRLVAGSLNLSDPQMAGLGAMLAADSAFQVRYELLTPLSRWRRRHAIAPIVRTLPTTRRRLW